MSARSVVHLSSAFWITFCLCLRAPAQQDWDSPPMWVVLGRQMSEEQAKACEETLKANPDDLQARGKLLGYYDPSHPMWRSGEARRAFNGHVLWIIGHHPEHKLAGVHAMLVNAEFDPRLYQDASKLWLKQVAANEKNTAVLANAAYFFAHDDPGQAESLLERARSLEPDSPEWHKRLADLHTQVAHFAIIAGGSDKEAASQALQCYEAAMERYDPHHRAELLLKAAQAAILAERPEKARKYATEVLDALVEQGPALHSWDFRHSRFYGNYVLGQAALLEGDVEEAERYLPRAADSDQSERFSGFGPNMMLAKDLLECGRRDAVIEYLEKCKKLWQDDKLDRWIRLIKKGRIPDFGANLVY
jgi:tetratricopeptide (TPR) repeat protein